MSAEDDQLPGDQLPGDQLEALLAEVSQDLTPVRPLRLGRWFFSILVIFCSLALTLLIWRFGLRSDHAALGMARLWGLSALELSAASVLLGLSLRHAIPGRNLNSTVLGTAAIATGAFSLLFCQLVFARSPIHVPEGQAASHALVCFSLEIALGLPVLLIALGFLRGGLVTALGRAGILGGLGAGLMGDTLWRLICPYSDPLHAVSSHTGGIFGVAAIGLLLALLWDRARIRNF